MTEPGPSRTWAARAPGRIWWAGAQRTGTALSAGLLCLSVAAAGWPAARTVAAGHAVPFRLTGEVRNGAFPPVPGQDPAAAPGGTVRHLMQADLLVVSARPLPAGAVSAVGLLRGVTGTQVVDAARISVGGRPAAVLGVNPGGFRPYAAAPTARDGAFWHDVSAGELGVSYTMGKDDRLPPGTVVSVAGRQRRLLAVGAARTVGITGVDAVVSHAVARSLGFPMGNALVISAPKAHLKALLRRVTALVPSSAAVEPLVAPRSPARAGRAGEISGAPGARLLMAFQVRAMLRAALSRVGMPYVWGAAGPSAFDCSGLVQWSFAQAGITMPRVAADQALTGPAVPLSQLAPGDLVFYHTDPTAPHYISHVAIYLGHGLIIQAPEPGMKVEVVPLWLGSEFAGAVSVSPQIAARVAAAPVG